MSFSECSNNSPKHCQTKSVIVKSLRNRYTLRCMNKSDEQLDKDYPFLLMRLEKMRLDVDKAFTSKMYSPANKCKKKSSENVTTEISKDSDLTNKQVKNIEALLSDEQHHLRMIQARIITVSSPNYRQNLKTQIDQAYKQIGQLRKQIKTTQRNMHNFGTSLTKAQLQKDYKLMLESLHSQNKALTLQIQKNQQLSKQLQLIKKKNRTGYNRDPSQDHSIQQIIGASQSNRPMKVILRNSTPVSPAQKTKKKQLKQLAEVVSNLDDKIKLADTYVNENRLLAIEFQRLAEKARKVSHSSIDKKQ